MSTGETVALDTDVLVHYAMSGCEHHSAVRHWIESSVERGRRIGLTQQVLYEFIHVVTDTRRFEHPMAMSRAVDFVRRLWAAKEVARVIPRVAVVPRVCELIESFRLGRKRVLDTALAATIEGASVSRIATFNVKDFAVFPFLHVEDPSKQGRH